MKLYETSFEQLHPYLYQRWRVISSVDLPGYSAAAIYMDTLKDECVLIAARGTRPRNTALFCGLLREQPPEAFASFLRARQGISP